jgi:hypothetical protein
MVGLLCSQQSSYATTGGKMWAVVGVKQRKAAFQRTLSLTADGMQVHAPQVPSHWLTYIALHCV